MIFVDDWLPHVILLQRENVEIKPLEHKDYRMVPTFTASWLPKDIFERTIFSAHGYARFIMHNAQLPLCYQADRIHGFYVGDQLLGFAEWKLRGERVVLNNIFIDERIRGLGVGTLYLQEIFLHFKKRHITQILLDVFTWNEAARQFYERLGFFSEQEYSWYEFGLEQLRTKSISTSRDDKRVRGIMDWSQAMAMADSYGFGYFKLQGTFGEESIGLLNASYYRIRSKALHHAEVVEALQLLSQSKRILVTDGMSDQSFAGMTSINSSVRMKRILSKGHEG